MNKVFRLPIKPIIKKSSSDPQGSIWSEKSQISKSLAASSLSEEMNENESELEARIKEIILELSPEL